MSREIKFRAWDSRNEQMLFSSIVWGRNYPSLGGISYENWEESTHADYLSELMQYTGLKDKNGVEIYEGDIVYLAGYGDYNVTFPFTELYEAAAENDIGDIRCNTYENPELLEAKS